MAKVPGNSSKIVVNSNYFQGGNSIDPKLSIPNAFYASQALDFRTKPSQMSVLPGMSAMSGTFTDLITTMEQDLNGVRYGVGDQGYVYKINNSNVVSSLGQLNENGSAGMLYNQVTDNLYIPGQTKVSLYGQTQAGSPTLQKDIFAQNSSINNGCTQIYNPNDGQFDGVLRSTASVTYSVPTTLTEVSTTYCLFSPDIEPGYSISVYIVAKGTGNWTLTLHDSQNNALASVTKTNASLTNGAFNEFVFGNQVRMLVGGGIASGAANYHFHLTSTVNDGTVQVVSTANGGTQDMMSVNMLWSAYRLVQTANGWHPTALFGVKTGTGNGQALCIGNGQYLSTYNFGNDGAPSNNQWIRHQLVFKTGYEVCGLSVNNQYLVIAVERRSKTANRKFQDGALYFWDGTTPQPSFVIEIPMGAPYGLSTFNNVTYFSCAGSLFAWSGGQTVIKVRQLAYQNTDYLNTVDNTIVNPNMFTSRYNLFLMAYPTSTTNTNIKMGVWSWGSVELTFPLSYGFSYALSNGYTQSAAPSANLKIGACYNFVDTMYTSWQYTDNSSVVHYGLDLLDNTSSAAPFVSWSSLIYDGGARYKQKGANRLKISHTPLPSGVTVTPWYILDRGSKVSSPVPNNTVGSTNSLLEINQRYHEIEYGFDATHNPGLMNPEVFTGVSFETDPEANEVDITADN